VIYIFYHGKAEEGKIVFTIILKTENFSLSYFTSLKEKSTRRKTDV